MKLSMEMQHKLAVMALYRFRRDEPVKPKTLYITQFQLRSEAVGGGALPEDEIQLDFCISSDKRDGHYSYMDEATRKNYAAGAAAGVPFMLDHGDGMLNQIGRTIAGTYDESTKRVNSTISMLRDTDNTPDNMKVDEYIRRIERRYYDSCSVGFRGGEEICRLDGKDIWDWSREDPCPHVPGGVYDGKTCEYDVIGAHLREVSLVPSGSNPDAKLLDRNAWDENLRKIKQDGLASVSAGSDPKTMLERDGLKYREALVTAAVAEGIRAEDGFDEAKWRERFKTMEADTIIDQTATWKALGNSRWGEGGRVTGGEQSGSGGSEPILILPPNVFEVY